MNKEHRIVDFKVFLLCAFPITTLAHQPIMDMAPRWSGGYGFQVRQEHHASQKLLSKNSKIDNPFGKEKKVDKTWFEGVYTFTRSIRITFKLPYINQSRTIERNGATVKEQGKGIGDLILGIPLKYYWNDLDSTGNINFTPSIAIPTGSSAENFPVSNGGTNVGASFSLNIEKANLYQYYDLFYWKNNAKKSGIDKGDEMGFDLNVGLHPYHSNQTNTGIFLMVDVSARHEKRGVDLAGTTGGTCLSLGPVFVFYRQNVMFRAEYKYPVYERVFDSQVSFGPQWNVGFGLAF